MPFSPRSSPRGWRLKEVRAEGLRWLRQAENDLEYARLGKRVVFGHSLVQLGAELSLEDDLRDELAVLDQYYIPARYPNGLPGALPYEVYTKGQAARALEASLRVIELSRRALREP